MLARFAHRHGGRTRWQLQHCRALGRRTQCPHESIDARAQLRIAHDMLESMGMAAFAERARRELQATGETARKRTIASGDEQLTAQEAQIARMAREFGTP